MRALVVIAALGVACESREAKLQEEAYARQVVDVLTEFQASYGSIVAQCNRGPLECAVAAQDGSVAARRARSRLASLAPPSKLAGANGKLIDAFGHLEKAYDAIAETYWDRAALFDAYRRSMELVESSLHEMMSAALVIGIRGEGDVWRLR